jgi:hypothetical protein
MPADQKILPAYGNLHRKGLLLDAAGITILPRYGKLPHHTWI